MKPPRPTPKAAAIPLFAIALVALPLAACQDSAPSQDTIPIGLNQPSPPTAPSPARSANPLFPGGIEGSRQAMRELERAQKLLVQNNTQEAIEIIDQIMGLVPVEYRINADFFKATAFAAQGDLAKTAELVTIGKMRGAQEPVIALAELQRGNKQFADVFLDQARATLAALAPPEARTTANDRDLLSDNAALLFSVSKKYRNTPLGTQFIRTAITKSPKSPDLQLALVVNLHNNNDPEAAQQALQSLKNNAKTTPAHIQAAEKILAD